MDMSTPPCDQCFHYYICAKVNIGYCTDFINHSAVEILPHQNNDYTESQLLDGTVHLFAIPREIRMQNKNHYIWACRRARNIAIQEYHLSLNILSEDLRTSTKRSGGINENLLYSLTDNLKFFR